MTVHGPSVRMAAPCCAVPEATESTALDIAPADRGPGGLQQAVLLAQLPVDLLGCLAEADWKDLPIEEPG